MQIWSQSKSWNQVKQGQHVQMNHGSRLLYAAAGRQIICEKSLSWIKFFQQANNVNFRSAVCGLCGHATGAQNNVVIANDLQFAQNPFALEPDCFWRVCNNSSLCTVCEAEDLQVRFFFPQH